MVYLYNSGNYSNVGLDEHVLSNFPDLTLLWHSKAAKAERIYKLLLISSIIIILILITAKDSWHKVFI